MTIKGFGINADAAMLDGSLDLLRKNVEYYMEMGFNYVEVPVHGVGAMAGGHLITKRVEEVRRLLDRFHLIPIAEIFSLLAGNDIVFVHEIRPRYQSYAKQALELGYKHLCP